MPSVINIANMCSHIQNASKARLGVTSVTNTKYNLHLALAMHRSGFFSAVYRGGPHPPSLEEMVSRPPEIVTNANVSSMRIWLGMKYWDDKAVFSKAQTISQPKRIITADTRELARLAQGFPAKLRRGVVPGLNVGECLYLATSCGVLELREALSRKVGGFLMCRVS